MKIEKYGWSEGSELPQFIVQSELENLLNSKNIMLIDVTETWGILEYRKISGSINNTIDFKEKYNEVKPSKSD
uniref:Thiosulfate sulfurtransferase like domain containing 3 n=1 Tax=Mandrillus leucophaeus TaxID=9568 RepID=A0A2K5YHW1_MANLE